MSKNTIRQKRIGKAISARLNNRRIAICLYQDGAVGITFRRLTPDGLVLSEGLRLSMCAALALSDGLQQIYIQNAKAIREAEKQGVVDPS